MAAEALHLADDLERSLEAAADAVAEAAGDVSRRAAPAELLEPAEEGRLLQMAVEEWGMMAVLWAVLAFGPFWAWPAALVLLAGRYHALGVVLHDATHMPLQGKPPRVRAVEMLCGYPIASTLEAMRYHHLRHHRDSGMATDPYYKAGRQGLGWWVANVARGLLLVPFWAIRAPVGVFAVRLRGLRNVYARVFLQDRSGTDRRDASEVLACARAEPGQLLFFLALGGLAFAAPSAVLWGWAVPVSLAGVLAARRLLLEHRYERVADRRPETILRTTADNHLGWLGRVVLAPRNIGFHVVHHLHPRVGLEALPRLREWYRERNPGLYPAPRN